MSNGKIRREFELQNRRPKNPLIIEHSLLDIGYSQALQTAEELRNCFLAKNKITVSENR